MHIPTTGAQRPTSRFVEHLRTLLEGSGRGRVGFRAQAEAPKRHVGLVASLPQADLAFVRQVARQGVDAVEVPLADRAEVRSLAEIAGALDLPVGVAARDGIDDDLAASLGEAGFDWARLALDASWPALGWEHPSRFLTVPLDVDLRIVAALNAPFVEAVVLAAGEGGWSRQIAEGLRLRTISEVVKKPLLLALPATAPALAAEVYTALGVDALILAVDGPAAADRLAAHAERLQAPAHERS